MATGASENSSRGDSATPTMGTILSRHACNRREALAAVGYGTGCSSLRVVAASCKEPSRHRLTLARGSSYVRGSWGGSVDRNARLEGYKHVAAKTQPEEILTDFTLATEKVVGRGGDNTLSTLWQETVNSNFDAPFHQLRPSIIHFVLLLSKDATRHGHGGRAAQGMAGEGWRGRNRGSCAVQLGREKTGQVGRLY